MTERPAEAASAADSHSHEYPLNALVDPGESSPRYVEVLSVANTVERVRDALAMLDELDFRDGFNSSAATGIHWTVQTCLDALQSCHHRLMTEVGRACGSPPPLDLFARSLSVRYMRDEMAWLYSKVREERPSFVESDEWREREAGIRELLELGDDSEVRHNG